MNGKVSSFDLEQQILNCWGVISDIDTLNKQFEITRLSQDEIQSALTGLRQLYDYKFQQLFNTFEDYIQQNRKQELQ